MHKIQVDSVCFSVLLLKIQFCINDVVSHRQQHMHQGHDSLIVSYVSWGSTKHRLVLLDIRMV